MVHRQTRDDRRVQLVPVGSLQRPRLTFEPRFGDPRVTSIMLAGFSVAFGCKGTGILCRDILLAILNLLELNN